MSFYRNTNSGVRLININTLINESLPTEEIFRVVSNDGLIDMVFKAKEYNKDDVNLKDKGVTINNKCQYCCFRNSCIISPFCYVKFKCNPTEREDKKDIIFERVDMF